MRILQIDFMGQRRLAMVVSIALVVIGVAALALRGLSLGLDFTGGVLVEVGFERDIQPEEVRLQLAEAGYEDSVVQNFGSTSTLLIRMPTEMDRDQAGLGDSLLAVIRARHDSADLRRIDFIGPVVGEELREQGGLAVLVALLVVMLYIMFRFTGKFSVGAVVALVHDVVIAVGAFAMFGWSFDLSVLAAMLAVIGYSLNDTIVVSDRIRENFRLMRRSSPIEVINASPESDPWSNPGDLLDHPAGIGVAAGRWRRAAARVCHRAHHRGDCGQLLVNLRGRFNAAVAEELIDQALLCRRRRLRGSDQILAHEFRPLCVSSRKDAADSRSLAPIIWTKSNYRSHGTTCRTLMQR